MVLSVAETFCEVLIKEANINPLKRVGKLFGEYIKKNLTYIVITKRLGK